MATSKKATSAAAKARAAAAKERLSKSPLAGFMTFVREQGVVGLAVGLAIGTQAGKAVEAIVKGLIDPIVAFLVGSQEGLQAATWTVVEDWYGRDLTFSWGMVLSALITLAAVAGVIYWVVHGLKLDKLDKKKA